MRVTKEFQDLHGTGGKEYLVYHLQPGSRVLGVRDRRPMPCARLWTDRRLVGGRTRGGIPSLSRRGPRRPPGLRHLAPQVRLGW
jgi:hypothetical protein